MAMMMLGLAAAAAAFPGPSGLPAVPDPAISQFSAGAAAVQVHRGGGDSWRGGGRDSWRGRHPRPGRDRRRDRGFDSGIAYIDREYQGDTVWRSDSFNDWWHERPNRSFPRWTTNNGRCDRMWWGGEGWRC